MKKRVAVVHDYFIQMGGAEKVAEELINMIPEADLIAIVALPDKLPPSLAERPIKTSWMQHLPALKKLYRFYFWLYPFAIRSLDLSEYDLVISCSSSYAKGVAVNPDAVHVCYCHTPTRWVWNFANYSSREGFKTGTRWLLAGMIRALRAWDKEAAQQPDHFIANSETVERRIKIAYDRSAEVIFPPIDVNRFSVSDDIGDYFIVLSRLVPYKRIDLAIKACNMLGARLIVIGSGPDRQALERIAGPTVLFTGRISDAEVERYVSSAKALIFPGEEDFGMAPLEVASAGRPTVAYRAGGAVETILDGETGIFFDRDTPESLAAALLKFDTLKWNPTTIQAQAQRFSREVFHTRMRSFLRMVGSAVD